MPANPAEQNLQTIKLESTLNFCALERDTTAGPAQPSQAKPSPAQPSPAQPSQCKELCGARNPYKLLRKWTRLKVLGNDQSGGRSSRLLVGVWRL